MGSERMPARTAVQLMDGLWDPAGGFQRKHIDSDTEVSRPDRTDVDLELAPHNGRVGDTPPLFANFDTEIGRRLSLVSAPERIH